MGTPMTRQLLLRIAFLETLLGNSDVLAIMLVCPTNSEGAKAMTITFYVSR